MKESEAEKALYLAMNGDVYGCSYTETAGRSMFDTESFKADHPDLYNQYFKKGSPFRTFRVSFKSKAQIEEIQNKKLKAA